jgi:hypothetical protein
MTFDDIKIIGHKQTSAQRFGHWVFIRNHSSKRGRALRKTVIGFFEQGLGPIGIRWQYQKCTDSDYILKLNDERDFLFFLLKIK